MRKSRNAHATRSSSTTVDWAYMYELQHDIVTGTHKLTLDLTEPQTSLAVTSTVSKSGCLLLALLALHRLFIIRTFTHHAFTFRARLQSSVSSMFEIQRADLCLWHRARQLSH